MSLADLMGGDLDDEDDSDEDPEFSPDQDFSVATPPSAHFASAASALASGDCSFGVPYEVDDDDDEGEGEEEENEATVLGAASSSSGPSDEIRFSYERFFSPRLHELLRGSTKGGDPASATGLLTGVRPMLLHQSQSPHPERPARMVAIYDQLIARGLDARSRLVPAREASTEDLTLVHTAEQVAHSTAVYPSDAAATAALGLDSDTYFSATASGYAARLAAGSVVELVTRVMQGELTNALAVVRPPGHHCEAKQAMGFCLLNNVCVAVAAARRRLGAGRILVVDWDVHHGNGVQNIFAEDPTVLYVSLHRFGRGFYPGTGHPAEVGSGAGEGTSVNIAWQRGEGYSDAEYLAAFDRIVMPIARQYSPELVIVSAGFDAARGDPLGGMDLTPAGYAHMTSLLGTLACGRLVVALEGGYNLRSIATSAAAVHGALLGEPPPRLPPRPPRAEALADIEETLAAVAPYWACLQPPKPARERRESRGVGKPQPKRGRARGPWWYKFLY